MQQKDNELLMRYDIIGSRRGLWYIGFFRPICVYKNNFGKGGSYSGKEKIKFEFVSEILFNFHFDRYYTNILSSNHYYEPIF